MITLSTAKKIMLLLRKRGVRLRRLPEEIARQRGMDGVHLRLLCMQWIAIRKGAPFTVVIHELGHALDDDRASLFSRIKNPRKEMLRAEIAANREGSRILAELGSEDELRAFRAAQCVRQEAYRRKNLQKGNHAETRYELRQVGKTTRFVVVFKVARKVTYLGNGEFRDGRSVMTVELSTDGCTSWKRGRFLAQKAVPLETATEDGMYEYRVVSAIPVTSRHGQMARISYERRSTNAEL